MSALACEPGKGSELEVGFRALLAAASRHEVWVLTNSATIPIVRRAIEEYPWADRVHFEGIYFDVDDELYPQLTTPGFHRYYDRWQRKAAVRAVELDERIDFDVVHHVTLAASWTRAGVTTVDKPLVWGPVGGGGRDAAIPATRTLAGEAWSTRPAASSARRLLADWARTPHAAARCRHFRTEYRYRSGHPDRRTPARAAECNRGRRPGCPAAGPRRNDIIFAARLLPWKGGRLAVRALRYVHHPDAVLRIFGDGPERRRIARAARRWGVADRVRFEGRVHARRTPAHRRYSWSLPPSRLP